MRAWVLLALCCCGRIGFDALPAPDAPDVGYFVSPIGSDGNPGTRAEPWGTLPFALSQLRPGDVLNLEDGDYDGRTAVGTMTGDCSMGLSTGTAVAPIVVRADHPRRARLFGRTRALFIKSCAYWELRDLWVEGIDDTVETDGSVVQIVSGDHVTVHGLVGGKPNRNQNNHVIEVDSATNVLVEDVEIYDFHRAGIITYDSDAVTVRRAYMNGRGYPDLATYPTLCPGGDYGMYSYYSRGSVFEDTIVENVCYEGFAAETGRNASASGDTGVGDNHHFANDIAISTGIYGFWILTDCDSGTPCSSPDRIASNNTISNSVAWNSATGFLLEGVNNALDHTTALDNATQAVSFSVIMPADPGLAPTAFASDSLGAAAPVGVSSFFQTGWGVDHSNMYASGTAYSPNDAHVTASTAIDPKLGGCTVYMPPTSTMIGAGTGGGNIGADIRTQALDGAPTATPYWNPDRTFAGCGAIVPGVNDDPATSCIGVGARLNVGANGCPPP